MIYRFRTNYKGHDLDIQKKKDSDKYIGTSTFLNNRWNHEDYSVDFIIKRHQIEIDRIVEQQKKMIGKTYEEVYREWRGNTKVITYKNCKMLITARKRAKDNRIVYLGEFSKDRYKTWIRTSIESIHYDKVIAKFERFVDEYCTDWGVKAVLQYKGYEIKICREVGCKEFYFGSVQFHKNSTFKHIADTREEVERCCKNRIDKVIYEKEKVKIISPRNEKIKELEELLTRISTQLEELKKEKDTLTYKGVVLEIDTIPDRYGRVKGLLRNISNPAPFVEDNLENLKKSFESYVDKLENQYLLFCKLTGRDS